MNAAVNAAVNAAAADVRIVDYTVPTEAARKLCARPVVEASDLHSLEGSQGCLQPWYGN